MFQITILMVKVRSISPSVGALPFSYKHLCTHLCMCAFHSSILKFVSILCKSSPSVRVLSFSISFHTSTHAPISVWVFSIQFFFRFFSTVCRSSHHFNALLPTIEHPIAIPPEASHPTTPAPISLTRYVLLALVKVQWMMLFEQQITPTFYSKQREMHSHFCLAVQSWDCTATYLTVVQRESAPLTLSHTFQLPSPHNTSSPPHL